MNLHSNLQYPLLKYLSEEFTGKFYNNELTFLNRLLILYHNRFVFSIDDDHHRFIDELRADLTQPVKFWTIPAYKRRRINLMRGRFCQLLSHKRSIVENLLSRPDYSTTEAKRQTIAEIYQWLNSRPKEKESAPSLASWKKDMEASFGSLLESPGDVGKGRSSKNVFYLHFHNILTGKDEETRKAKFLKLLSVLLGEQWICETETRGIYQFRKSGNGSRLLLGALYYCLNQQGQIQKELTGPQVARLFNSWLRHDISPKSFEKVFQAEEQDTFNCSPSQTRYKYVRDCSLLIKSL
ncbi:hypothetical protein [Ravibacter arvi]|uniref:hypothetical protein n=1 Tax=Ravibacter arvi TaxID=2051041 RepID=UPI0031EE70DB